MSIFTALALFGAQWGSADGATRPAYELVNPRAIELFERDPELMGWALRFHDANSDGHLSIREADKAALAFKRIADGDTDGQVTPAEYRSALDYIVARWTLSAR